MIDYNQLKHIVNMIDYNFSRKSKMAKKQHGGKRSGSGRKVANPEGPAVVVTASVPGGLVERMNVVAEKRDWSRSEAVTEAIRGLVKRHERRQGESDPS